MAKKPRHLSAEEAALWSDVARTTTPLPGKTTKSVTALTERIAKTEIPQKPANRLQAFEVGQKTRTQTQTRVNIGPEVGERISALPISMDRKQFRKLSKGKLKPEGRIDLHGMTLAQARPVLTQFILSSQAGGRRLVLVITGKGRADKDTGGPIPERRGILRDQVPRWLTMAPCKSVVMQIAQAHASHGGGGAYYVYLRRSRQ